MRKIIILLSVSALVISGCDLAEPKKKGERKAPPAAIEEAPPAAPAEPKKPETVDVKAEAGVGAKGHVPNSGGESPMDIIVVPINSMFWAKQKIVFDQMQHAMNLYKAEHEKLPSTHEEFWEKIIVANQLKLPELPDGQSYIYDPEREELMVRKPKQ